MWFVTTAENSCFIGQDGSNGYPRGQFSKIQLIKKTNQTPWCYTLCFKSLSVFKQQQITGYPRLYYTANSFHSAWLAATNATLSGGTSKGFPHEWSPCVSAPLKAAVWSTAVLPTWLFYCLTATEHCHYNDGKCHLVVHNPQKLCTDCRNSPRWKFKTSLLLGHELNYSAVPAEVSSCREMKASLNVELLLI